MPKSNEFLRSSPRKRNRNVIFDLSNLIIPVVVVAIGIVAASQTFARLVRHDPAYTGAPVYVTTRELFSLPAGYRFYNPGAAALAIASKPFDPLVNAVLFETYLPLIASAGIAVFAFFLASALRGRGLNKNDGLYGSARWGTEKDLETFGLAQDAGVVLAQLHKADVRFKVNPENASISLALKREAPLVCHSGGTNTLLVAPTRSGKGVGSIIPTCLNFPGGVIIFDPKGENFHLTAGFRSKFSHVLKFSPLSKDTLRFNPLEEVSLDEQAFADIGLVIGNMFEEPKGGNDGASAFFDNNAKDILTGVILHVLSSNIYGEDMKTLGGVLSVISKAAGQGREDEGGEKSIGEELLLEMREAKHYDKNGRESETLHKIVANAANRCLGQNPKVRGDVFSTVFSKMSLFEDPSIAYATGGSDFKLRDFYDSDVPISLYLTVPFSDITRIAPVFKTLVNFMLAKFSRGETAYGEQKMKNRLLFLLDEFPTLGAFPFLSKTMGILAGYGITFFIVVQALNQIIDIYGQNHTFLDNCKTVMVYAPGKVEDAKMFSEMIGKRSVVKESVSTSGSRYATALNNINESSQEVAVELINPDELMKLPPSEALVLNQGMPPYIAKKVVYYMDARFKDKAYSVRKVKRLARVSLKAGGLTLSIPNPFAPRETAAVRSGFAPPATRKALLAGVQDPKQGLPSQRERLSSPSAAGESGEKKPAPRPASAASRRAAPAPAFASPPPPRSAAPTEQVLRESGGDAGFAAPDESVEAQLTAMFDGAFPAAPDPDAPSMDYEEARMKTLSHLRIIPLNETPPPMNQKDGGAQ
jgi:type IV secretion system protein VirD4